MKLSDIELTDNNHFVAMEYYFLILNRTFLVIKQDGYLIGIKANGLVGVEGGSSFLEREVNNLMAIRGDLDNPYSYLKNSYLEKVKDVNLLDGSITKVNSTNFLIKLSDIKKVEYNPSKKWGMGPYPHDGRVTIKTINNKTIEFIILGNQSGRNIANWITK